MKGENINILKKSIRQRRAISSGLYENVSYNYSEEEKNKSKNSIKGFHRKTTSSYFCGSYLSSNLEDELLNNINIDQICSEKNKNEEKDNMNDSNTNKDINLDIVLNNSFHSFDSENNKINEENSIKNENKTKIKEEEKENKKNKNFISLKNNLKNLKDKDDRVTNSYLLALGMTKYQNRKEQYIPTVSVIEEEKSDVIDSRSEFSNKKKKIKDKYYFGNNSLIKDNLFFLRKDNKLKIRNIFGKKNNSSIKNDIKEENKENKVEQNDNNKNEKFGIKLSNTLNEIITKNNKKEENKRKYLKKNKVLLLNSFFSNASKNKEEKYKSKIKNNKDMNLNGFKNTENNRNNLIEKLRNKMEKKFQLSIKEKIRNSYFSNFIKKRYNTENNINNNKGSLKNKIIKNKEIIKNQKVHQTLKEDKIVESNKCINLDDTINSNLNINKNNYEIEKKPEKNTDQINYKHKSNIPIITKIEYRPSSKIPHLRQKIIERKEVNSISNVNTTNISNSNSILNKNSAPNRKYISKYKNIPHKKTHSFNKDNNNDKVKKENFHSVRQRKSINEAIEIIRIERIKSKNKNKPSLKRLNELNKSKSKHNYSSSFIKPININNSKSSRDKETNFKISIKKANSGTFRNDISLKLIDEKTLNFPGNKNSTINALKLYLKYEKKYIQIDAIKKIEKTFNSENSFFVIISEKITISKKEKCIQNNNYIFVFKSLMKYYSKQNRFIKIYGYENEPNALSIKNININKFEIYLLNSKEDINDELFFIIPIQELKFNVNAIFLCKK